ncbi:MAG TPA: UDP-3-O-(3-hydroxymyristoyl)glucosamine N-acyltransferase [Gemmatimonadaceae bacterium]
MTPAELQSPHLSGERACTLTARAIADIVGGKLIGAPGTVVGGVAPLDRAGPGDVSFVAQTRYASLLRDTAAGVVLITAELADSPGSVASRVVVAKPHDALLQLIPRFYPEVERKPSIHSTATVGRGARIGRDVTLDEYVVIGSGASLGDGVWIGAHTVVGDGVRIGERSRIHPNVTVYAGTDIGARVRIHSGAVLGSDGFGYVLRAGQHAKIPHVGRCVIGDDVEIGANSTVDRGSIDDTVIGAGTKIDNLVQIGHNVRVGRLCLIISQVGISGSARIGDGCVLGGQAGIGGHITIGPGARIAGQAGVFGDVPPGESWSGYPARPHRESLRATAALLKLPQLLKKIELLLDGKSPG